MSAAGKPGVECCYCGTMLDYLVILIVGVAGFARAPCWFIILGVLGLCLESWPTIWNMIKSSRLKFDQGIATFFIALFGNALIACSAAYIVGVVIGTLSR
jgi:hypothetical protein